MRFIAYILLALQLNISKAENKLILCTNYSSDGTHSGTYENWSIQKGGNYMYLFYESISPITDTVYISISKKFNRKDTNYYEYDHYYLVPDSSKKWAVNKYTFTKSGSYKISVHNRFHTTLSSPLFTDINLAENEYNDIYFPDTWYYNQSKIYFYEKAIGDSMVGKSDSYLYNAAGNKIILYIEQENKSPLKSGHLFISIYTADKCHEFINSFTYYINEKWYWTFVPINFNKKGKFIVELYNDDDVFINSSILEIK